MRSAVVAATAWPGRAPRRAGTPGPRPSRNGPRRGPPGPRRRRPDPPPGSSTGSAEPSSVARRSRAASTRAGSTPGSPASVCAAISSSTGACPPSSSARASGSAPRSTTCTAASSAEAAPPSIPTSCPSIASLRSIAPVCSGSASQARPVDVDRHLLGHLTGQSLVQRLALALAGDRELVVVQRVRASREASSRHRDRRRRPAGRPADSDVSSWTDIPRSGASGCSS